MTMKKILSILICAMMLISVIAVTMVSVDAAGGSMSVVLEETTNPANGSFYVSGEKIEFKCTVTNTGAVALTNLGAEQSLSEEIKELGSLASGSSASYKFSHTVTDTEAAAGEVKCKVEVTGKAADDTVDETSNEVKCATGAEVSASISVSLSETSSPKNGSFYLSGETIKYQASVTNTGAAAVTDLVLTDSLTGGSFSIGTLYAGESGSCSIEYKVTDADALAGSVSNTATAQGNDPLGSTVSDTSSAVTSSAGVSESAGSIEVTLHVVNKPKNGDFFTTGEKIKFSCTITNTGSKALSDVTANDSLCGDTKKVAVLSPSQSTSYSFYHTVSANDFKKSNLSCFVRVKAKTPDGASIETLSNTVSCRLLSKDVSVAAKHGAKKPGKGKLNLPKPGGDTSVDVTHSTDGRTATGDDARSERGNPHPVQTGFTIAAAIVLVIFATVGTGVVIYRRKHGLKTVFDDEVEDYDDFED